MANNDYFIDIERIVKWTYEYSYYFTENDDRQKFGSNTVKQWRNYSALPGINTIKEINKLLPPESQFVHINIAEFLICINNAKDHNRGKTVNNISITSTGKKVLNLLLLGRYLDNKNKNKYFSTSDNDDNKIVYDYLTSFNNSNKKTSRFYYLPGRTISLDQLCSVGSDYTNRITAKGIKCGLYHLVKIGLVSCVDDTKQLYKLDFTNCFNYYDECTNFDGRDK